MMKQDEIDRCLVLFYVSRNNAMEVNYTACCERIDKLCVSSRARDELVDILRRLADDIQRNYPSQNMMFRELDATRKREAAWRKSHFERNKQYGGEAYAKDVDIQEMMAMYKDGSTDEQEPEL
jgi:hypothetical protein